MVKNITATLRAVLNGVLLFLEPILIENTPEQMYVTLVTKNHHLPRETHNEISTPETATCQATALSDGVQVSGPVVIRSCCRCMKVACETLGKVDALIINEKDYRLKKPINVAVCDLQDYLQTIATRA